MGCVAMTDFNKNVDITKCNECIDHDCGGCPVQTDFDVRHLEAWIDGRTNAGQPPTDDEILAELDRFVCEEDSLLCEIGKGL